MVQVTVLPGARVRRNGTVSGLRLPRHVKRASGDQQRRRRLQSRQGQLNGLPGAHVRRNGTSVSWTPTPLALQLLKALTGPSTTVAVVCSREDAAIGSELAPSLAISVTVWSFHGTLDCLENIARYLTQDKADFPQPGVAFVPYAGGNSMQAVRAIVAKFEKYHANIQCLFATRNHADVLATFSENFCNVISVIDIHIDAPLDGYMPCKERQVLLKTEEMLKAERVPPRGTYSRNKRIRFAMQDEGDKFCFRKKIPFVEVVDRAYEALNNTFVEECNHGDTDYILLDKRVDLILSLSNRELTCADENEAVSRVKNSLRSFALLARFMRVEGVMEDGVTCDMSDDDQTQLSDPLVYCLAHIRQYLKLGDIRDAS
ncbi:hypothetical protein HPB50_015355 [Hyalomma asiaticum]|uniref:Uncharacterized protein n=1 Tax=Hyalomma asiaticum TaxID=266040 RepID=A0ACB7T812_HYAAI|nr:hypothetical protein HPB50_015355 [Hyalomma asiaticum]